MASSNRHWPSLFKSKPRAAHLQGHHDHITSSALLAGACSQKPPYSSSGVLQGMEERTPEPKPRWNPKPEQIRILEAIFNSGMVNPPRDEIRRIRAQLQVYGQVGDANVFYWFQNRKSRSKQKQRHLQASRSQSRHHAAAAAPGPPAAASSSSAAAAANSSSSSSSEPSAGSDKSTLPVGTTIAGVAAAGGGGGEASHSPTASVNQTLLQGGVLPAADPLYFQSPPQGCYFSAPELPGLVSLPEQAALGLCAGLLELPHQQVCLINGEEAGVGKIMHPGFGPATAVAAAAAALATTVAAATPLSVVSCESTVTGHVVGVNQAGMGSGGGGGVAARSTVFINEVAFEVGGGLIDVKDAFGDAALLFNSSGHPVAVDERGVTLHPLQHGASYYLV